MNWRWEFSRLELTSALADAVCADHTGLVGDPRFFRMTSRWRLPFARNTVFDALADADAYPTWWPQVHDVHRVDERSGTARLRSLLPMSLYVSAVEEVRDPRRGILRATLAGDLVGWSQWCVSQTDDVTTADFTQEVLLRKKIPALLLTACRPLLALNHSHMMRAGNDGLIRRLDEAC